VPLVVQVMLFISPVIYPLSLVPESYRALLGLNPMVGVLETFRWAVLPDASAPGSGLLLVSVGSAIALLISGLLYFNRAERSFADHI
jgi:lipopolysaccharide transport system permease protein